mmetsp:Transcript_107677/g.195930  ORF Transcript_107677/g.195930 Transcript_107677/m.195930 type:complete len:1208 (+) Transcript_107677:133-3756(+)
MGNCTYHHDKSRSGLVASSTGRSKEGAPGFDVEARVSFTCAGNTLRAAGASQSQGNGCYSGKDAYATAGTKWLPFRGPFGASDATDDTDLYVEGLTDVGADAWHNPLVKVGAATCRKGHPLVKLGCNKDWICAGRCEPGGCRSGFVDTLQYEGIERYRCEACNYDLCEECYRWLEALQEANLGFNKGANLKDGLKLAFKKVDAGETMKCDDTVADTTDGKSSLRRSASSEKVKAVRISQEEPGKRGRGSLKVSSSTESVTTTDEQTESEPDPDSDSDGENEQEPTEMMRKRKGGILAAPIEKGKFQPPWHEKDPETERSLRKTFGNCVLFQSLTAEEIDAIINTMPVVSKKKGENIFRQGESGDALFVVLRGKADCFLEAQTPPPRRSEFNVNSQESRRSRASRKISVKLAALNITSTSSKEAKSGRQFIATREDGAIFGELSIIFNTPRSLSVYAREAVTLGKLEAKVYQNLVVRRQMAVREKLEDCLRQAKILETLQDEQIAKLADALQIQVFKKDKPIICQGDEGKEFFIVNSGECVVTVNMQGDVQEHCRYGPGDLFGELALLANKPRAATITAVTRVEVFKLSRRKFERMLGSMSMLHAASYKTDPRKLISDFYRPGDEKGPKGSLELQADLPEGMDEDDAAASEGKRVSNWFAVFRPTSRDAVAKMLSGAGVGKGLNVKGKSAKKNRLSGFVPFLQISDNAHKKDLEALPKDSRIRVFYRTEAARTAALNTMRNFVEKKQSKRTSIKRPWKKQKTKKDQGQDSTSQKDSGEQSFALGVDSSNEEAAAFMTNRASNSMASSASLKSAGDTAFSGIPYDVDDGYAPAVFGLVLAGPLLHEIYLVKPDLSPSVEWETGRKSEPAFMNMNLHAVTSESRPEIVLYQHDEADPMNPRGLLIAYAEKSVKPVVSDFDAFLVASRNMRYKRLPHDQADLVNWCLTHVEEVLASPGQDSWTTRWLEVLREESDKGFHPTVPEFGFGDPISIQFIRDVVNHTSACGAVRHGAECFNFYFPQELDDEYLIVWEGFPSKPWEYVCERELRDFVLKRVGDGFRFPVNPVWPVRDPGWYEVLSALKASTEKHGDREDTLDCWYPKESGILDQIDRIHEAYPRGFEFRRSVFMPNITSGTIDASPEGDGNQKMDWVEMSLHNLRRNNLSSSGSIPCKSTTFGIPRTTWFFGKNTKVKAPTARKSYFFKKNRFGLF